MAKTTRGSALSVIVRRAAKIAKSNSIPFDRHQATEILLDVHQRTCPLRLTALAKADDFNLAHDVFGILRHYMPRSGRLRDCFSPRYHA